MRVLLEEVVLDRPGEVETNAVGDLDLLERIGDQLLLGVGAPRSRQLVLVEDPEAHCRDHIQASARRYWAAAVTMQQWTQTADEALERRRATSPMTSRC